jgi:predicted dehydrogenase
MSRPPHAAETAVLEHGGGRRRARARKRVGIGLIGFGWLGQAHSRSMLRIPTLFRERGFDPELVICSDTEPARVQEAVSSFGYRQGTDDWRRVVDDPAVDAVFIAAPNMFHLELIEAAADAGKHVFCEKPVGGTPEQTVRAERAARRAGVISGVGYNYRWAPLVLHARQLIAEGRLGEISNYRGRFFSMYGSDPLGLLSWRFLVDEGGYGASTDLLSHAVDLAHMLVGPIARVVGTTETFIRERPLPSEAGAGHYGRGRPEDPRGAVTNEDYAAMLCVFESGARGTFEASRTIVGPESQMAFEAYGTEGAVGWNLERMNELELYLASGEPQSGYTTVFGGDRFPYHGAFVPGSANGIGFEDLVAIEDYEFCAAVADGRPFSPGFAEALDLVSVQAALLESNGSGRWEDVVSLRED